MSKIAHLPANADRLQDRSGWHPEQSGCADNPGVFDTGNGAMEFRHVNPEFPGVVYVEFSSYCGREEDDSWFEADGQRFSVLDVASRAASASEARREREAQQARAQREAELATYRDCGYPLDHPEVREIVAATRSMEAVAWLLARGFELEARPYVVRVVRGPRHDQLHAATVRLQRQRGGAYYGGAWEDRQPEARALHDEFVAQSDRR